MNKTSLLCEYLNYVELFLESEGQTPVHAVVLYKGRMFSVDMVDDQEEPLRPPEIQHQLTQIKEQCDKEPPGIGLGALTGETRKNGLRLVQVFFLALSSPAFLTLLDSVLNSNS